MRSGVPKRSKSYLGYKNETKSKYLMKVLDIPAGAPEGNLLRAPNGSWAGDNAVSTEL